MPVYMDPPFRAKGKFWCHLWADTDEELHAMARRLGLKREWHQSPEKRNARWSHYDICSPAKRQLAARLGVILTDKYGPTEHVAKLEWNGVRLAQIATVRAYDNGQKE